MSYGRAGVAWAAGIVMVLVALSGLGWLKAPRWKALSGLERLMRTALRGADELPALAGGAGERGGDLREGRVRVGAQLLNRR